jgi:hypothetical protein
MVRITTANDIENAVIDNAMRFSEDRALFPSKYRRESFIIISVFELALRVNG